MKKITYQTLALRQLFKNQMALKGFTYGKLAKEINVSVPTVKRWMKDNDIPFEKVLHILEVFGLSIEDLSRSLKFESPAARPELKKKDEEFLVKHPKEAYVLLLLSLGYKFEEMAQMLHISHLALEKIMLLLDRNHLITYVDSKNFRSLVKPPIKWAVQGPFAQRYFPALFEAIVASARPTIHGRTEPNAKPDWVLDFGEIYMTEKLESAFKEEFAALIKRYKEMTRLERSKVTISDCHPISYVAYVKRFSCWKKAMWEV